MNSISRRLARIVAVCGLTVLSLTTVSAQTPATSVDINIQLQSYDVIYVVDMIDVTTGSISNAIPNVSFTLTSVPSGSFAKVHLEVSAFVQLKGEAALPLVTATTRDFDLNGFTLVSSRDLASKSGSIQVATSTTVSGTIDKLKNYISNFPTAPVGTYTIQVRVLNVNNFVLGSQTKTVEVKNSSAAEVAVTLLDPMDGSVISTVLPTFSWTAEKTTARIRIFEKLPQYQSAQDAISGIPHLVQLVNGSTLTYPPDARKLEPGKTYYWFVETDVTTNRGIQVKQSEIRMFRVMSGNFAIILQMLERLFSSYGGYLSAMVTTMQEMGLEFTGDITKDGTRISREELAQLFNQFITNSTKIAARVE